MISREKIASSKRWVIKIGSALLTADGRGLSTDLLSSWVEQIASLRHTGHQVVLVSSGAVAEGMSRMGWQTRPHNLNELQAAAAIGQMGLVQAWEAGFQKFDLHTAQ
ncbi:MAG: glutamate 5-kinase, partial [Candidatus Thiodiazotropha taylori]